MITEKIIGKDLEGSCSDHIWLRAFACREYGRPPHFL